MLFWKCDDGVADLQRNSGPGIVPLKVRTLASAAADPRGRPRGDRRATMFGSGLVSTTCVTEMRIGHERRADTEADRTTAATTTAAIAAVVRHHTMLSRDRRMLLRPAVFRGDRRWSARRFASDFGIRRSTRARRRPPLRARATYGAIQVRRRTTSAAKRWRSILPDRDRTRGPALRRR